MPQAVADLDAIYDPVVARKELGVRPTVAVGTAEADEAIGKTPNAPYRSVWVVADADELEKTIVRIPASAITRRIAIALPMFTS